MTTESFTPDHLTTPADQAWWRTAPNPQCRPWCKEEHSPTAFTKGGSLICVLRVKTTDWYVVEVTQITSVEDDETPGVLELDPVKVWSTTHHELVDRTPAEVAEYAAQLLSAATLSIALDALR